MAPPSKDKSSKIFIERPTSVEGSESSPILSVVKEAATFAPISVLKRAACSAIFIFKTTEIIEENKEAYERLGYDSIGLIDFIWRSFNKMKDQEEWLSAETIMRDVLDDLSHALDNICSFLNEQLSRGKVIRVICNRADAVKINKFLEHLKFVRQKFELRSDITINNILLKNYQTSKKPQEEEREFEQPTEHVEVNHQSEGEHWLFDELKKIKEKAKDRKSELECLRVLNTAYDRLRKVEEEAAHLKRELAATIVDNRQSTLNKIRVRSSGEKSFKQEDEDWEGNTLVDSEEAASEEEEERSAKAKRNASRLPKIQPIAVENLHSLHSMSMRSAKARMAHRKVSSRVTPRVQEMEDDYADTDSDKRQTSSIASSGTSTRPRYANDFMVQLGYYQGFMPVVGPYSAYGFSSSLGPYGYGVNVATPGSIVNAGTGNINTSIISNVGNVKKFYCPRSQRRRAGN